MNRNPVIAAVRSNELFSEALRSGADTVFVLVPNITQLKDQVELAHKANKKIYIHIDLAEGIGKDEYGIRFSKDLGIDGVISTRSNIIKLARNMGLNTVQRFFIVDSHSVETTIESARSSKPSMIEIMPGTMTKIIGRIKQKLDIPIIAGGLIETEDEVADALNSGAAAVSVGKKELWK